VSVVPGGWNSSSVLVHSTTIRVLKIDLRAGKIAYLVANVLIIANFCYDLGIRQGVGYLKQKGVKGGKNNN